MVATPLSDLKYMETRRRFDRRGPRTKGKSGRKGDRKILGRVFLLFSRNFEISSRIVKTEIFFQ